MGRVAFSFVSKTYIGIGKKSFKFLNTLFDIQNKNNLLWKCNKNNQKKHYSESVGGIIFVAWLGF